MSYDLGSATGTIKLKYDGSSTVKKAITDIGGLRAALSKVGITGGTLGKLIGVGVGGAVVAGLALATQRAAEFEHQISAIAAVSGATGAQLDQVRAKALQLGADTVFSASEAAGAMEELIKAGLTTEEVLNGAADATVALAAAGGIPLKDAATIAANAMNQFNLQAEQLPGIVDDIAGVANSSAIDVSELGQSLQQAGAVANLAGLSFQDTAVAIGLMGDAGIRGSDAGTSLKTMLQNLQPTTAKQIALAKQLGIVTEDGSNKFFDQAGNVKDLAGVAGVLSNALKGQSRQQKLLNLETLFGTDAIRAAAIVANNGAKGVKAFTKEVSKTTAAEVAAKRMDNLSGSVEQLTGSLDTAAITIGSGLLVPLRLLVDLMTEAVNVGTELGTAIGDRASPGMEDMVTASKNLAAALSSLLSVLADIGQLAAILGIGAAIALFNTLASVLAGVTGLMASHKDIVGALVFAYVALKVATSEWLAVMAARALFAFMNALGSIQLTIQAMSIGLAQVSTAMSGLIAAAGPFIALAAVGFAAIKMWTAYRDAVDKAKSAIDDANKAIEGTSVSALQTQRDNLLSVQKETDSATSMFSSFTDVLTKPLNPLNWDDIMNAKGLSDNEDDVQAALAATDQRIGDVAAAVTIFNDQLGGMDTEKLQNLMADVATRSPDALNQLNTLVKDMEPRLAAAGISLEDFIAAATNPVDNTQLENYLALIQATGTDSARTKSAAEDLGAAFQETGSGATDAAKAADDLKASLDALVGVELSAVDAQIQVRDGIRTLVDDVAKHSRAIIGNTAAADQNKSALNERVQNILDNIDAEARAGKGSQFLALQLKNQRQQLINSAVQLGFNKKELEKYLDTLNLTPENVKTIVEAVGAQTEKEKMEALIAQYDLTPKEVKTIISASGAETTAQQLKAIRDYLDQLHNKDILVTLHQNTINTVLDRHLTGGHVTAEGGVFMNGMRMMARGGLMNVDPGIYNGTRIKYAEAGAEAYIPMRKDKRRRSEWLLQEVAKSFGGAFVKMAEGGVMRLATATAQVPLSGGGTVRVQSSAAKGRPGAPAGPSIVTNIYYPVREKGSDAVTRRVSQLAASGMLDAPRDEGDN